MCPVYVPLRSYFADAVSSNHVLSPTHFEDMHTFRLDWQPGGGEGGEKGYLRWYLDDEQLYGIDDDTLVREGAGGGGSQNTWERGSLFAFGCVFQQPYGGKDKVRCVSRMFLCRLPPCCVLRMPVRRRFLEGTSQLLRCTAGAEASVKV